MKAGLFKRKEIWVPTWKGWALGLLLVVGLVVGLLKSAVPFLSPNKPLGAEVLVMEGWVDEFALDATIELARKQNYKLVVTAGGEIERGLNTVSYKTYANLGKSRLIAIGFPGTNVIAVSNKIAPRDRTYHSALAIREYLLANTPYRSLDLVSSSTHARRSWFLYDRACWPEIKVGVYSIPDPDYDWRTWYKTSQGVRTVIFEGIGYLYARLFFNPDKYEKPAAVPMVVEPE